jgi:molecular chaperone GrpE
MKNKTGDGKQPDTGNVPAAAEPLVAMDAAHVTPEQLQDLKDRAAKADENWDRLLRTTADFDNYRKRAAREKQEAIKYANESLLQKLVPVLDAFDKAVSAARSSTPNAPDPQQAGVMMIHQQLKAVLLEAGLEEIDASEQMFDPNLHEAVSQQETADAPEGRVVLQLRKGYKLRDRLLRPASVIVARQPAA